MGGMGVDDGFRLVAHRIDRGVQERFLRWLVATDKAALRIQLRQTLRVEIAKAGVGGRHEPAIVDAHAEIARRAVDKATMVQTLSLIHI